MDGQHPHWDGTAPPDHHNQRGAYLKRVTPGSLPCPTWTQSPLFVLLGGHGHPAERQTRERDWTSGAEVRAALHFPHTLRTGPAMRPRPTGPGLGKVISCSAHKNHHWEFRTQAACESHRKSCPDPHTPPLPPDRHPHT